MAEQISLEKTQLELELTQVKQQLERQQDRIKVMIEEHLEKTEQVRQNTERRCREEHSAIRTQSEEHAGQLAQLTAELDRSHRKEMDLKKHLSDQKRISDKGMYEIQILYL